MTHTILVIDDDDTIRRVVSTTLERAGFRVIGASDGVSGIEAVKDSRPDLIVVDLLLPGLMGFDVCRRVRDLPAGAKLPIIVMSAVILGEEARREIRDHFGIRYVFAKPFPFKDLLNAVNEFLVPSPTTASSPSNASAQKADNGRASPAWSPEDNEVGLARFRAAPSDEPPLAEAGAETVTLPELLIQLFRAEATGILVLSDGRRRKEIAFNQGAPVRILAAFPGENIGQTLLDLGRVERSDFERAVEHATRWNLPLEQTLVATKLISDSELPVYQRLHAHQVILAAFTAYGCTWSFRKTEMSVPESLRVAVDPFVLVWEGVSETLSLQELTSHFLPHRTRCPELTDRYELFSARLAGVLPTPTPIESIDGKTPIAKLLARSSVGIASTLRLLYALELCGALKFNDDGYPEAEAPPAPVLPSGDFDSLGDVLAEPSFPPPATDNAEEPSVPSLPDPWSTALPETPGAPSPGFVLDAEREYAVALDQVRSQSWDDALLSSQRAVEASPNDPRLHICLAETLLMSVGIDTRGPVDPSKSMDEVRAVVDAEAELVTALRLQPRMPRALSLLARVCLVRGRREQARTLWGFAHQIDPENDEIRASLAVLSASNPAASQTNS